MSSSSAESTPAAPGRAGRRRPLVYTVEAPEGGATVLHRLAPADGGAGTPMWTGAYAVAVVAAAVAVAASLAAPPSRPLVAALTMGALLLLRSLLRSRTVVAESILVIAGLGIQLQTHFVSGREAVQFVDLGRVRAVLINEGITMHRVIYYLAFVVEGQEKLIVAFPHLQPRLEELLPVYESLRPVVAAARAGKGEAASTRPD